MSVLYPVKGCLYITLASSLDSLAVYPSTARYTALLIDTLNAIGLLVLLLPAATHLGMLAYFAYPI